MEDIWDWVLHPYPEGDEVVPCTSKTESYYDLTMLLPHTLVSAEDDAFEDEEEPNEEEPPTNEIGGVYANNSPYQDSSSHQETQVQDLTESE